MGDEKVAPNPGQGHILAKSGPQDDLRVIGLDEGEDTSL
jgi:hypothetical protein